MPRPDDIGELSFRRSELHHAGAIAEAIPLQVVILRRLEARGGPVRDLTNAHNYLSVLYTKIGAYEAAEAHARQALDLHQGGTTPKDHDALACYSMMLARILTLRRRRDEALPHAERALSEWALVHKPPSNFLSARQEELAALKAGTWKNPFV